MRKLSSRGALVRRLLVVLTWVFGFIVLGLGATACDREAPPLVDVTEIAPREVELGGRLELRGTGFPQGRTARVTFRGTIYRPGAPEQSSRVIETEGMVATTSRIEVPFSEMLEEKFCGRGEQSTHGTFVGDVEVAFASSAPSRPPVVGVLRAVSFDARPASVRGSVVAARAAEGARVLGFLGLTCAAPTTRGFPIEAVAPGSPADRAGIEPGDLLTAVDGVHATELSDVLPASARSVRLTLKHGDSASEEVKTVTMVGFASERITLEYVPAIAVVGLALVVLLVLIVPSPAGLMAIEQALALRLKHARFASIRHALLGRGAEAIASLVATVLLATLALGGHLFGAEVDGAVLLVGAVGLLMTARILSASTVAPGFLVAIFSGIREALQAALLFGLTIAGCIVMSGSIQFTELVRAQGAAPWEWAAMQKPAGAALAFAFIAALVVSVRPRDDGSILADAGMPNAGPLRVRPAIVRVGLLMACALAAGIFFGGWQLPFGLDTRGATGQVLGAALFMAKTWLLASAVLAWAFSASPWRTADARAFLLRFVGPAIAFGWLAVVATRRLAVSATFETAFGAFAVLAMALLFVRSLLRVRSAALRPEPHASPFL